MNRIKTYDDLLEEKKRLQLKLELDKKRITENWEQVKTELSPVTNIFGAFGKMTKSDKSNPMVNIGLGIASDLLLKRFILRKAGWAVRLAVPLLMKNYSSHVIADKGKSFLDKIKHILFKKKESENDVAKQEPQFNSFTPDVNQDVKNGQHIS